MHHQSCWITWRRGREAGARSGAVLMDSTSRSAVSTCRQPSVS